MNKEFYCDICGKQYKNVGEMSNHYSSYDHHHVKVRPKQFRSARSTEAMRGVLLVAAQARELTDDALAERCVQTHVFVLYMAACQWAYTVPYSVALTIVFSVCCKCASTRKVTRKAF